MRVTFSQNLQLWLLGELWWSMWAFMYFTCFPHTPHCFLTLTCFWMWSSYLLRSRNVSLQWSQLNLLVSCRRVWLFNVAFSRKTFAQMWHLNLFSPKCTSKCRLRCRFCLNSRWQMEHLYALSELWDWICARQFADELKDFSHKWHLNFLTLEWIRKCRRSHALPQISQKCFFVLLPWFECEGKWYG